MSALFATLAIPSAKSALAFAKHAVSAVAQPFAEALQNATGQAESDDIGSANEQDDSSAAKLAADVAARLQTLLAGAGVAPGESIELSISEDGRIEVAGDSLALSAVQQALNHDAALQDDLIELAQHDGQLSADSPRTRLTVEAASDDDAAELAWS